MWLKKYYRAKSSRSLPQRKKTKKASLPRGIKGLYDLRSPMLLSWSSRGLSSDSKYLILVRRQDLTLTRKKTFFPRTITFLTHPAKTLSWLSTFRTTNMFLVYTVFFTVTELQTMSSGRTSPEVSSDIPAFPSFGIWIVSCGTRPLWRTLASRNWLLFAENNILLHAFLIQIRIKFSVLTNCQSHIFEVLRSLNKIDSNPIKRCQQLSTVPYKGCSQAHTINIRHILKNSDSS